MQSPEDYWRSIQLSAGSARPPEQSPPEWSEEEFRRFIGATAGSPLAPVLQQIKLYVEGRKRLTLQEQQNCRLQCDEIMTPPLRAKTNYPQDFSIRDEQLREAFRQFAAGLQFSYEKEGWQEPKPMQFDVFSDTRFKVNAYVGVDPQDTHKIMIALTTHGLGLYSVLKNYKWFAHAPQSTKRYPADTDMFIRGAHEGRHIAQHLRPELKHLFANNSNMLLDSLGKNTDTTDDPAEIEASRFIAKHSAEIEARSNEISKSPLPAISGGKLR